MAVDITALVGAENMNIAAKPQVIAIIKALPNNATGKRYLFARWSRLVGFHPTKADVDAVAPWSQ